MQVKTTAGTPDLGTVEWWRLRELVTERRMFTAVAVALAASDLPERDYLTFDDAVLYAIEGLARTGVEEAEMIGYRLGEARLAEQRLADVGVATSAPSRRNLRRRERTLWGVSVRRANWCTDVAHRLCTVSADSPAVRRGDPRFVPSGRIEELAAKAATGLTAAPAVSRMELVAA
jgi:hypothetical protein